MTNLLDQGLPVDVVYFDFRKAFDTVCHRRLGHKLDKIGISGPVREWIMKWLEDRTQRVVLNGSFSDWISVLSGAPQGSVLGPILFIIFINDIEECVNELLYIFADDTKLVGEAQSDESIYKLQITINKLNEWANRWKMQFNSAKCSVMHLGTSNKRHSYTLGGVSLKSTDSEKDVGIMIQQSGKFSEQCRKVANKCNQITGQVRRSFTNKDPVLMKRIFSMYILPHINYGSAVWKPSYLKDIALIESIQRRLRG